MTDEELMEKACTTHGCINFSMSGYIYCGACMNPSDRLPRELAHRKLHIEQARSYLREIERACGPWLSTDDPKDVWHDIRVSCEMGNYPELTLDDVVAYLKECPAE